MELDLAGRTALVTGASGDIGAACAIALAREGVRVRVNGRSAERLESVVASIQAAGGAAEAAPGDLADPAFVRTLTATPPPDLLIHAAGHRFTYMRFHAQETADAELTRKIEIDAFESLCAWALPEMMGRRFGRIIAVTSLAAHLGGAGSARYAAAKAALEALVRGIAVDYGRFGITANAVAPGFVETSRLAMRTDAVEERRARLQQATSVKRLARAEEIAHPIVFLCSPLAAYITGATLKIAGGADLNNLW